MTRASRHRRFRAALTLAIALRRHLSRIVRAVFATMLGSTAALAAVDGAAPPTAGLPRPSSPDRQTRPQLPILVHFVFDEHIGIEGFPEDVPPGRQMREFLRDFFGTYGFRVFRARLQPLRQHLYLTAQIS